MGWWLTFQQQHHHQPPVDDVGDDGDVAEADRFAEI
jgi:hypothetical protein